MTTPHPKIPQTVMKQDVNPELLYCPLPLPMSLSFPLLPSLVFVHLFPAYLFIASLELPTAAKITAEIIIFF